MLEPSRLKNAAVLEFGLRLAHQLAIPSGPDGATRAHQHCVETSEAEASAEAANRSGMSTLRRHHMSGVGRIGFPSPAQVSHGAPILKLAPFEQRPDELVDLLLNLD